MTFNPKDYTNLKVKESPIAGLFTIELVVFGDNRGWFKESYQQEKLNKLGLPSLNPLQNNMSYNKEIGVTRGLHAEPWEKYISLTNGSVFGAWVDLRKGKDFGRTFSWELNPGRAVFVPRGVANGYQTLEANVCYSYLVNGYWKADLKYTAVNLFDPSLNINWPIDQSRSLLSDKDLNNPLLKDVEAMEF